LAGAATLSQLTDTTVPVPAWPGFESYPGSVITITIFGILPEITEPDLVIELATSTVVRYYRDLSSMCRRKPADLYLSH
jgi:hypothetical protein